MRKWYQFHTGTQGMIRRGDQRSLIQLKSDIEKSKDKIFFINHISAGSAQDKFYLVQMDVDHSYLVTMRYYGVYRLRWYIRHK